MRAYSNQQGMGFQCIGIKQIAIGSVILGSMIVLALWGTWIHIGTPHSIGGVLDTFVKTAQLLKLPNIPDSPPIPWQLRVARIGFPSALFVFAYWRFSLYVSGPLRVLRRRKFGSDVLLLGNMASAEPLMKELRRRRMTVTVVAEHPEFADLVEFDQLGVAVVAGPSNCLTTLKKAGIQSASVIIVAAKNEIENVNIALLSERLLSETSIRQQPPHMILYIEDPGFRRLIESVRENSIAQNKTRISLYTPIFYVIRNLLMEYPLTRNWLVEAKQPGHLMIIGCTGLSEELILQASLTSHFPNVSRLLIYILGKDADAWWEGVLSRHSGLADICEFTVISADPEISSFSPIKAVQDATKRASLTGIYLCLTDSAVNWKLALALYGIGQEVSSNSLFIPTYVYSANMSSIAESLHSGSFVLPGLSMLVPFGDGHVEQSVDIFLDNKGEQLAIAVHEGYLSDLASGNLPITGREAAKGWDLLNERSKASCRQVADHFAIKLRSIRCRAVPAGKSLKPPFFFTADEIERLAEAEHRRWMSERLISGWRYGPQRDNALKIHPDLVPYDRLSDGSRKQDRGMIRRIPEQYAAAGFAIVRDHIIGLILSPEIDDESARLFATQLLGNIIRRCHQHTVVVCSLRQEAECRIIGTVLEEGNISLWVVTPTLSVLGSEQSALNLLARAERCLDLSVAGLWHETTTDLSAIYLGMCDEVMQ